MKKLIRIDVNRLEDLVSMLCSSDYETVEFALELMKQFDIKRLDIRKLKHLRDTVKENLQVSRHQRNYSINRGYKDPKVEAEKRLDMLISQINELYPERVKQTVRRASGQKKLKHIHQFAMAELAIIEEEERKKNERDIKFSKY
jgi:hypothetical protein